MTVLYINVDFIVDEGENIDQRLPPLLKVKSTSSLNLPTGS